MSAADSQTLIRSPFVRLADLLAGTPPGKPALILSVGEPRHDVPAFVGPVLARHTADFNRYPGVRGSYLASISAAGTNPGAGYLRLALVDHFASVETALGRLAGCLS